MDQQQPLSRRERRALERQQPGNAKINIDAARRVALWIGIGLLVVGGIAGLFFLSGMGPIDSSSKESASISEADWVKGKSGAAVSLVEYGDFQCPACGSFYPIVKQIIENYKDKIVFAYRHFPLSEVHKNAEAASYASEAAGNQGKFWEMYDLLFSKQSGWSNLSESDAQTTFIGYAKDLSLDTAKFEEDMNSTDVRQKVSASRKDGESAGVNSTPSFFLNNKKISNPGTYDQFRNLIEEQLAIGS